MAIELVEILRTLDRTFTTSGLVKRIEIAPEHWLDFRNTVMPSPWFAENLKYRVDPPLPTSNEFHLMGVVFARARADKGAIA